MIAMPLYFNEALSPLGTACSLCTIACIIWAWKKPNLIALRFATAWLVYTGAIAGTLSDVRVPFVSNTLTKAARECTAQPFAIAGYHEPSLVFLAGTQTKLVSPEQAVNLLRQETVNLAFLPSSFARPAHTFPVVNVVGINYNGGDPVNLTGYSRDPDLCTKTKSPY